ncbi:hypothetical protein Tco_0251602 [Tanacetum coccineum]
MSTLLSPTLTAALVHSRLHRELLVTACSSISVLSLTQTLASSASEVSLRVCTSHSHSSVSSNYDGSVRLMMDGWSSVWLLSVMLLACDCIVHNIITEYESYNFTVDDREDYGVERESRVMCSWEHSLSVSECCSLYVICMLVIVDKDYIWLGVYAIELAVRGCGEIVWVLYHSL